MYATKKVVFLCRYLLPRPRHTRYMYMPKTEHQMFDLIVIFS